MDEQPPARAPEPLRRDEGRRRPARVQLLRHVRPADRDRAAVQQLRPRQHPEKVVPRFITQALAGAPLTIHGDGHASRDWLYVDDHAEAIEALIETPIDGSQARSSTSRRASTSRSPHRRLVLDASGTGVDDGHVPERPGQVDRHIGSTGKMER